MRILKATALFLETFWGLIEGVDGVAKTITVIAVHALLLTLSKYASGTHAASLFIADSHAETHSTASGLRAPLGLQETTSTKRLEMIRLWLRGRFEMFYA